MKGGKKKSELQQAPRPAEKDSENSGTGGGDDDVDAGGGGVAAVGVGVSAECAGRSEEESAPPVAEEMEGQDEGVGDEGTEGEQPKLDEGFYEIEDVRRKRVRKGQVQYLIKWRGWPETANTWEPFENLQSCYDVIEAFEESMRAGKSRSSRKRKHKSGAPHSQPTRKQRSTPNSSGVKVKETIEVIPSTTPGNPSLANPPPPDRTEAGNATEGKICGDAENKHEDVNNEKTTEQPNDDGSLNVPLEPELNREANGTDPKLSELNGTASDDISNGKFTIHIPDARATEEGDSDGLSKGEGVEPDQSSCFTGARRWKSGSVKRFRHVSVSSEPGRVQNSTAICGIKSFSGRIEPQGMEDAGTTGADAGEKTKLDHSTNSSSITKVIKVVGYSASVSNNVEDASVNFLVLRTW
ncbi:chromo domain-containing protein LHP1-like isoform X2 [Macadamia integrifolia]|uniref:chromo domain-containing protein LHP1-like isoform X2 n=1 Tax=Macadamia integrifolia TaxID=60698 RepID=UPI001C4FE4A0|nr:chromo domain-containing protein LHP1-like isoform X2 [Macadamia integrifolia]